MKKVINILLLFILGLSFISCDRILKDPLSEGAGFGDLIVNKSNVTIDSNFPQNLDLDKAKVMLGADTISLDALQKNVKAGPKTVTIMLISDDESKMYSGKANVTVKANEKLAVEVKLDTVKNAKTKYKFIFNPSLYNVTVNNEVHLVGDLPGATWSPNLTTYPLVKQANGTWIGYFDIPAGRGFKFIYDSTSWNQHDIGNNGNNFITGEIPDVLTKFYDEDPN